MTGPHAGPGGNAPHDDLARRAAAMYGRADARLTLLRRGDNTVYRLDSGAQERLVLRLHTDGRRDEAALTSELVWLDHLSRVAGLPVPRPIRAESGSWAVRLDGPDHSPDWGTVLAWLDGESLPEDTGLSPTQARQAGTLIARLHEVAGRFVVPPGFGRPHYHWPYFLACWDDLASAVGPHVAADRLRQIRAGLLTLTRALPRLDALPGGHGLVHADTHPGNFVQRGAGLALLDFDRCGWGPFLLDIAHSTLDLEQPGRQAFMQGYQSVRPLPAGHDHPLRALRILAAIENLSVLARRPHELPDVVEALGSVEEVLSRWEA